MTVRELILTHNPWDIDNMPISMDSRGRIHQLISILKTIENRPNSYDVLLEIHIDEVGNVFGIDSDNRIHTLDTLELEDILKLTINQWNFKAYSTDKVFYHIAKWLLTFPEINDVIKAQKYTHQGILSVW